MEHGGLGISGVAIRYALPVNSRRTGPAKWLIVHSNQKVRLRKTPDRACTWESELFRLSKLVNGSLTTRLVRPRLIHDLRTGSFSIELPYSDVSVYGTYLASLRNQ